MKISNQKRSRAERHFPFRTSSRVQSRSTGCGIIVVRRGRGPDDDDRYARAAAARRSPGGLFGGLGGLLEKFQQSGHGDVAKSWVGSGQNQPISPGPLSSALGPSIIKALAQKTGMSEQELTAQLSQALPGFVDKLTPQGRLPTHEELARFGG